MEVEWLVLGWILLILIGFLTVTVVYARWNYGVLERLGIPVIKPFLIFGSDYKESLVVSRDEEIRRFKKYGKIYGAYQERVPKIYISDAKLIKRITTTDFDHFVNHGFDFGSDSFVADILDALKDDTWKTVRVALSPIFTTRKLKDMSAIAQALGKSHFDGLEKEFQAGRLDKFCFEEFCAPLLVEILMKCLFGVELAENSNDRANFITELKQAALHDVPTEDWTAIIPRIIPGFALVMSYFAKSPYPPFVTGGMDTFVSTVQQALAGRPTSGEAAITLSEMTRKSEIDEKYKRLGITKRVILAQGWEMYASAYMGIRDAMMYLFAELAFNPEVQEKVYKEITASQDSSATPYLSACIKEAMRLHIAFTKPERLCNREWEHNGLRIPKGMQVIFPVHAIHRNPEYYPEPNKFNPDRWLGPVQPDLYTYMTFGQGPRGCPFGQRFGVEQVRVLVSCFLSKFKIEKRADTICEPKPGAGSFIVTYEPIYIDLVKRQ